MSPREPTMNDATFTERLRKLIGRQCRFYGRPCRIVEVLAGEGRMILEARDSLPPIQMDQYGQAAYRANEHIEVNLYAADNALSEDLIHVLEGLRDPVI
jgi:hypothetical protein